MQQRAGLLYLSKISKRILLILELDKWTVPTFNRKDSLLSDAEVVLDQYAVGKIIPIELYVSQDKGFEYGTYICVVENEFLVPTAKTYCWACMENLPKNLHSGLKSTLNNQIIQTKIETILELEYASNL